MSKNEPRAKQLIDAINAKYPELDVSVWQSGGGTATLWIEPKRGLDKDQVVVLAGPGTYDWGTPEQSTFYFDDLSVGLNDQGASESLYCTTVDDVVNAVRWFAASSGWLS